MIKTKLFTKRKQTLRRRKRAYGYSMGKAGRGMLTNKDQYIAQRAVFNPVITMYNGKISENDLYICIGESLCYTEVNTL